MHFGYSDNVNNCVGIHRAAPWECQSLGWQKAAAVPLVTLTAWQALHDLGEIKQGDRVLIHAGAGGVGIAAIQLAKLAGAKVYTTASTNNLDFLKHLGTTKLLIIPSRIFRH